MGWMMVQVQDVFNQCMSFECAIGMAEFLQEFLPYTSFLS